MKKDGGIIKGGFSVISKPAAGRRNSTIDIIRGVMIFLMVMGHIGFGEQFDIWIHAFHMPVFFIVTGLFFKLDKPFIEFVRDKFFKLVVPYITTSVFTFVVWIGVEGIRAPSRIFPMFMNIIWVNTKDFPVAGALWFLTVLFFSEVIFYAIFNICKSFKKRCLLTIIVVCMGFLIPESIRNQLPYGIGIALVSVGFVFIGYVFQINKDKVDKYMKQKSAILILMVIVLQISIFINGYVNMKFMQYGNPILFYLNGFLGLFIPMYLIPIVKPRHTLKIVFRYFEMLGRCSLYYLCFNQIIIRFLQIVLERLGIDIHYFVISVLILAITMMTIYPISIFIENSAFSVLYGKKKNG